MLLLVDIGNTTITIGASEGKSIVAVDRVKTPDCMDRDFCLRRFNEFVHGNQLRPPAGASLCSVVPDVAPAVVGSISREFGIEPFIVSSEVKTGLTFSISNPAALGADRIANAAAAHALYRGNLLVVDFGTATTLCVITEEGEYKGGVIMPGPGMAADSLAEKTAKLPRAQLSQPKSALGDDTAAHIASGIIFGQAGAVERLSAEFERETGMELAVVVTGGYADLVAPYIRVDRKNPHLTLEGLRVLYELNVGNNE